MIRNQFIAFPFWGFIAYAMAAYLIKLKKIEHICLSAAIITAPWAGGFWIAPIKFELRLTYFFLFAALFMSKGQPQWLKNKIPSSITIPLFVLIGWSTISAIQAYDPKLAMGDGPVTMLTNFLYLYTIAKIVKDNADLEFIIKSAVLGLFFVSILSLLQYKIRMFEIGFIEAGQRAFMWWRPRSTFRHPNACGMYHLIILPIVFRQAILMLRIKNKKLGRNYFIAFCIGCFTLFITQNRGSWVGLAFGMLVVVFIDLFRRGSKKTRKVMIRIIITLLLLSTFPLTKYGPRVYERMFKGRNAAANKAESRLSYNVDAWAQLKLHPVFGVGVSNVKYYSSIIFTHNLYLLMASETGYPGFVFFIFYMLGHILVAIKAMKSKNMHVSTMGSAFLTTMLALAVASYPGPDYGITSQVSSQLWIVSGIMIGLIGIEQKMLKQQKLRKRQQLRQRKHQEGGIQGEATPTTPPRLEPTRA